MMHQTVEEIEALFSKSGGEFLTPATEIMEKLRHVKAYLFDWDGVFNPGIKGDGIKSTFAEPDAMGSNLLRFGHWLKFKELPLFGIITAMNNQSAFQLSEREHFHLVYYSLLNKVKALEHIENRFDVNRKQVVFVFDDVLDLSIAQTCGLRFLVKRTGSPLFEEYVRKKGLCDYVCANSGSGYAVREVCELLLGLLGIYSQTVDERVNFSHLYSAYLSERNSLETHFYTIKDGIIQDERNTSCQKKY
ncbi:MAG: phosphatase [Candidatus Scalindua sp. AMX11]|nr:MAG: phosphatase [Candidatus Scalindua sp.]NOG85206.1 phosphatase [Planctomycetota bacterium]RZV66146.1 MAG: phosphatase [Candidatus Scalindua sp. SCAELEC01]TDE63545.1 MAG: phosphatase [Candidatus Scalindua sp. AMX11]GJQ60875.1 MAG: hypothetical protein SCALA701_36760 [Candidatus Scalindua sp.]